MITLVFLFLASCHSVVHWAKNYFYCSVKLSRELGSGGGGGVHVEFIFRHRWKVGFEAGEA